MNIALMSHDRKKELMVQFCIAYCGILSKHTVCATNTTGKLVAEATGLPVYLFLSHEHGGSQQIGARIAYNEIDMVLFLSLIHISNGCPGSSRSWTSAAAKSRWTP